jgi:hypothetical protein
MTIDPEITAAATIAIGKTTSWLWDKYGKDLLSRLGKESKKEWDQRKWKKSAEKYLSNLYDDVSTLRVLGKSEAQPIERMYTDVNVLGQLSAEQRYRISQLQEDYEIRVGLRRQQKERQDGLALARETGRLFILGKPGAGKTTFLKHVALQAIKGEMGEKIPIFISLWRLANSGQALMPYILEQFRICDFPEAEPFVRAVLKDGRALVLFDGLDEVRVENEQRDRLITAVEDFAREFRDSQVFITCRLAVTDYTFEGFRYVEMADFYERQMQTFVFRWFQQDITQRDACWAALQDFSNWTLLELAQVPLLLSLLCLTYEKRNEFPQERDEIYKEATDALLNDWDASRRIKRGHEIIRENAVYENLTLKHKQKLLAYVAAQTFTDGQYFIAEKKLADIIETFLRGVPGMMEVEPDGVEVLRVMEAQHGIFVERAQAIYSFSHLTIQEYYSARYIVENEAGGTLPRLMAHVGNERWREVFLLTASMLSDATEFCRLYLQAMQQMLVNDKTLASMLQWCVIKGAQAHLVDGGLPALRAFYIFLNVTLTIALARALALVLVPTHTLDLVHALDRTLDQAHTLAYKLDVDVDLNIDRVLARVRARTLAPDLAHARTHFRTRHPLLALDFLSGILLLAAQVLTTAGSQLMDEKVATELQEMVIQLNQLCHDASLPDLQVALDALPLPTANASNAELQTFAVRLQEIARTHHDLWHEWKLSNEQVELLEQYLQANLLFVECLKLAYVPDRAAIENQILLPPGLS